MSGLPSRGFASNRNFTALALTLTSMTLVGLAHGQTPDAASPEPFRLVWSSSAGCHDQRAFLSELEWRTARLREARAGEHAIALIVETFREGGGVLGRLTLRRPDGELTTRDVPGVSCSEVEAAMALIAALTVDPLAGQPGRKRPQADQQPAAQPPPARAWSLRAEHRVLGRSAIGPDLTWGQALGAMLTAESSRLKPSVGLSGRFAEATASALHGSAELTWTAAHLVLCPVGAQPHATWDVRACAAVELGRLRGAGFATDQPATKSIVWSSAGVELAVRYELVQPLWIGLEGDFSFPFTRERFYVDPSETLHRVPRWSAGFAVGLGLRFF